MVSKHNSGVAAALVYKHRGGRLLLLLLLLSLTLRGPPLIDLMFRAQRRRP
jgi:hypothetical protein